MSLAGGTNATLAAWSDARISCIVPMGGEESRQRARGVSSDATEQNSPSKKCSPQARGKPMNLGRGLFARLPMQQTDTTFFKTRGRPVGHVPFGPEEIFFSSTLRVGWAGMPAAPRCTVRRRTAR